jgi:hypothetical protein
LDTERAEVSTERTEKYRRKSPEWTIAQRVNSNSKITTQQVFLRALLPNSVLLCDEIELRILGSTWTARWFCRPITMPPANFPRPETRYAF